MLDFLNVTKEQVEEAKISGFPSFGDKESATFQVIEIKNDAEKSLCTVGMKVLASSVNASNVGKTHNIFIGNNAAGHRTLISLLSSYYSESQILGGAGALLNEMIGKKIDSVCRISKCGKYQNFNSFLPVSDVPAELTQSEAIGVPANAQTETAPSAAPTLF